MRDSLPKRGEFAERIRQGHPDAIEEALQFLDDDCPTHGSGYIKEECWRALSDAPLSERQSERLQYVTLKYLDRQVSREFWCMCRAMAGLADDQFQQEVDHYIETWALPSRQRASLCRDYLEGLEKGKPVESAFKKRVRA